MNAQSLLCCTILWLPLAACGSQPLHAWPAKYGKVLEEGTNIPIANAVVIANWQGDRPLRAGPVVVDSQTVCYHVESAITNARGEYQIPAWREGAGQTDYEMKQENVFPYKEGYWEAFYAVPATDAKQSLAEQTANLKKLEVVNKAYKQGILLLVKDRVSNAERLAHLKQMVSAISCDKAAGASNRNAYPLYERLYYEAKAIADPRANAEEIARIRAFAAFMATMTDRDSEVEHDKDINNFLMDHMQ